MTLSLTTNGGYFAVATKMSPLKVVPLKSVKYPIFTLLGGFATNRAEEHP